MQRVATAPATRCSTDAFEVRTTSLSRDAVRARRFCHAVVALAASAWSAVALLNWTVNPYAQYAPHFIPPLVQTSRRKKWRSSSTGTHVPRDSFSVPHA